MEPLEKSNLDNPWQLFYSGKEKVKIKDYHGAIDDYNKAIELKSDLFKAYFGRGYAKYKSEDYQGAIEDYNKSFESDETINKSVYFNSIVPPKNRTGG